MDLKVRPGGPTFKGFDYDLGFDCAFDGSKTQTGAGEETPDGVIVAAWGGTEREGF